MVLGGRPVYPAERCLLATGVADAAFTSKRTGASVETPHLGGIKYIVPEDQDERMWRPLGPRPTEACLAPWKSAPWLDGANDPVWKAAADWRAATAKL